MKKLYLLLPVIALSHIAFAQDREPIFGQPRRYFVARPDLSKYTTEGLMKFVHSYFRSDPYKAEFSTFLRHLLNDPEITAKEIFPRTDSSFFYFHGTYSNFNPFFFKPKKVDVLLTETEGRYSDINPEIDTIYVYHLTAYTDYTEKGIEEVKKEFKRITHRYQKKFYDSKHEDLMGNGKIAGGINHYFIPGYRLAPLSIAWGKAEGENLAILNITLRMKSYLNMAISPAPFYKPE